MNHAQPATSDSAANNNRRTSRNSNPEIQIPKLVCEDIGGKSFHATRRVAKAAEDIDALRLLLTLSSTATVVVFVAHHAHALAVAVLASPAAGLPAGAAVARILLHADAPSVAARLPLTTEVPALPAVLAIRLQVFALAVAAGASPGALVAALVAVFAVVLQVHALLVAARVLALALLRRNAGAAASALRALSGAAGVSAFSVAALVGLSAVRVAGGEVDALLAAAAGLLLELFVLRGAPHALLRPSLVDNARKWMTGHRGGGLRLLLVELVVGGL